MSGVLAIVNFLIVSFLRFVTNCGCFKNIVHIIAIENKIVFVEIVIFKKFSGTIVEIIIDLKLFLFRLCWFSVCPHFC